MDAELFRQEVVLERRVQASEQDHNERSRLFLRIHDGGVEGYGEVASQPRDINGDPGIDDVLEAIDVALVQMTLLIAREGGLPLWSRVARLGSERPARRVASALVEMAVLDRELKGTSCSIEELWPQRFTTPTQSTVSLLDEDTPWGVDPKCSRVRVKTASGPIGAQSLERLASLGVPVLLDFNCSASDDDDVVRQVNQIREVAVVSAVEQPYGVGNVIDHARLAARLDVALSLDESVRSLRDVTQIVRYGAASMLCVKPARVGGLANARTLIERARELGLTVYLGGFFESPYARHVHRALARTLIEEPSDIGEVAVQESEGEVRRIATSFGVEPSASMLAHAKPLTVTRADEP
jgi:o-succinylbenzoate synthase